MADIDLSVESVTRMLSSVGLEPHEMLRAAIGWLNPDETAEAEQRAREEFAAAGLLDSRGISEEALDWLTCLSRASIEYLAVVTEGDTTSHILVAGRGAEAVIAHRVRSMVRLRRKRNEYLAQVLVDQLPRMRIGRGSVNVRLSDLASADEGFMQTVEVSSPPGVEELKRIVAEPATHNGELYVGVRDRLGRYYINGDNPIRFRDSARGCILISRDGDYISTAPATEDMFVERLQAARAALTSQTV